MKSVEVSKLFGYGVSLITASAGILILSGFLVSVPEQIRIIFGVVLLLLGVYRFVITQTRTKGMDTRGTDAIGTGTKGTGRYDE